MSQSDTYKAAGFGVSVPRGMCPGIVVVDFSYGFTDLQYPTASDAVAQMAKTKEICDVARAKGFPVIFTTIAYHPGELDKLPWLKKATGMRALIEGTRLVEIDAATGIQPEDAIVTKKGHRLFWVDPERSSHWRECRHGCRDRRDDFGMCSRDCGGCGSVGLQRSRAPRLLRRPRCSTT